MSEHSHKGDHEHGHANDQGFKAVLRYLRWAPQMWRSDINKAVLELVAPAPAETVLDIGAGMGPGTVLAAETGATVVAVEPTPFMRRILTARRLANPNRRRITVVDGTAEKLPVPDGHIDALWSVNAMHHWVDPEQAAVEIARVLKPGGRVVLVDEDFTDPAHPDFERFGGGFGDHSDHSDGTHHGFTMVDAEQMGSLLLTAGFAEVDAATRNLGQTPVIAITGRR